MKETKGFTGFAEKKSLLIKAYDKVLSSDLLPVSKTGKEQVMERRNNLLNERFFVAVCGQIKSGKSALLNALVFGDSILPMDDTVMTAKNTLIQFGNKPMIEVEFYDDTEWKTVYSEIKKDKDAWRDFETAINEVAKAGVYKDECVLSPRRIDKIQGFDNLSHYVCPAKKGGKFNPFVKMVKVFYPHTWLENVILADTPGVNDPLKSQEDITKKWVSNAGAVVYVTYAGQAMDTEDFNFLNEYLLHVPSDKRVIAVNKIDIVKGLDDVKRYINRLRSSADNPELRSIFGDEGSVVYICALGALIEKIEKANKPLSKDLNDYRNELFSKGYLNESQNGLEQLRGLVEERLLRIDGRRLLKEHENFIISLFERKKKELILTINEYKRSLATLEKDHKDLENEKESVENKISQMNYRIKQWKQELYRNLDKSFKKLNQKVTQCKNDAIKEIKSSLDKYSDIKTIGKSAAWDVKDAVERQSDELFETIEVLQEDVERLMRKFIDEIRRDFAADAIQFVINTALDISIYETIQSIQKSFRGKEIKERFYEVVNEATSWWQRLWDTSKGIYNAKIGVLDKAHEMLEEEFDIKMLSKIISDIKSETAKVTEQIETQLQSILEGHKKQIDDLLEKKVDKDVERESLQKELDKFQGLLESVERLFSEVKQTAGMNKEI